MVATSFTAGALCVSAASLVAAGIMSSQSAHWIYTDPSRNLLGLASHLQVFALSDWLAVSLPVEFHESARGLQWLIPRLNFPWEKQRQNPGLAEAALILPSSIVKQRGLASAHDQEDRGSWTFPKRKLGANASIFGPPLSPSEYVTLFEERGGKPLPAIAIGNAQHTGWKDFEKNMLGLGIFGGGLLMLHVSTFLLFKWRMERLEGTILLPRFELFLLILAVPCICQASAFLLRGGTRTGIVVGVLLLSIPAAFLLSVLLFITVAVLLGALVLYKESRHDEDLSGYRDLWNLIAGSNASGEWLLREGLAQSFLARFGLLFEDRKGPPKLQNRGGNRRNKSKSLDGSKSVRSSYSDDETEANSVPRTRKIFGAFRSGYIVVDLSRRVILGIAFGIFESSELSRSQVLLVLSITIVQLLYLAICKPYISKVVQVVESISLVCEASIFGSALALLRRENAVHSQKGVAAFMLSSFFISFVSQVGSEWYALVKQLMAFTPRDDRGSLGPPLKMVVLGLAIPFLPRRLWTKLLPPTAVPTRKLSKPIATPEVSTGIGTQNSGSGAEAQAPESGIGEEEEQGPMSEIRLEASRKGKAPADSRRQLRGVQDAGPSSSSKELKLLQELARASFRNLAAEEDGDSTGLGLEVSPEISPSRAAAAMASTSSSPFLYSRSPAPSAGAL